MTSTRAGGVEQTGARDEGISVEQALMNAASRLDKAGVVAPGEDAELLLAHVRDVPRDTLQGERERALAPAQLQRFDDLVEARARRKPLAYILGHQPFHGIDLLVNENTPIPRLATETLVDVVLERLARVLRAPPRVLDVGTGSGNVALALACAHPGVRVVGTEIHPAPLEMAQANAVRLGVQDRIAFLVSDLLDGLSPDERFAAIACNPPHDTEEALHRQLLEVRAYEPWVAMLGGPDGLDFYRRLVPRAPAYLEPGGYLAVEIPDTRLVDIVSLFVGTGSYEDIEVAADASGLPRVVVARQRSA